ncbi:hypothetical protein A0H81_04114 [Grifola frondosa]|uniref:Uncharacterized protein n=1 Tax=Grifola frondosa TaxID=5627 RepID=A0A1C7MG52_GRIFR|nr:hypothetical protein A0H81_04114 [Grifola frondosa]
MSSGKTAEVCTIPTPFHYPACSYFPEDKSWKAKEQGEEARYEQAQLAAIHDEVMKKQAESKPEAERDFEGGFGGQEDLEDRYATTLGEH